MAAFEQIVPGASEHSATDWVRVRGSHQYLGRPVIDWSIAEAMTTVLSPEGYRFVMDALGMTHHARSTWPTACNTSSAVAVAPGRREHPTTAWTRSPGRSHAPSAEAGGTIRLSHELSRHDLVEASID